MDEDSIKKEIKQLLKGYRRMDRKTKLHLAALGFKIHLIAT